MTCGGRTRRGYAQTLAPRRAPQPENRAQPHCRRGTKEMHARHGSGVTSVPPAGTDPARRRFAPWSNHKRRKEGQGPRSACPCCPAYDLTRLHGMSGGAWRACFWPPGMDTAHRRNLRRTACNPRRGRKGARMACVGTFTLLEDVNPAANPGPLQNGTAS